MLCACVFLLIIILHFYKKSIYFDIISNVFNVLKKNIFFLLLFIFLLAKSFVKV